MINKINRFKNIGAVIFDLDGLMVYSEELGLESWRQFLAEYGFWMGEDEYHHLIGIDSRISTDYVIQKTGLPIGSEEILRRRRELMLNLIDEKLPVAEGLFPLVRKLSDFHYPMAVASNSFRTYVEHVLNAIKIRHLFNCVVTVDDVLNGKPSPDIYLSASKSLKIPSDLCLALEDSPAGMRAALDAGMTCVVIANRYLQGDDFSEAHARFDSLSDFLVFFRTYMSRQENFRFA
jgi:putative hydrolase of the HAD superfamily